MLDGDTVGKHTLTYRVTDSWGRETVVERVVYVTAAIEDNIIEFYSSDTKDKAFTLNFDSKSKKLRVIKENSKVSIDRTVGNEKAIEIVRYNENEQKTHTYTLTGDDTNDSAVLDSINEANYDYGEYISIYVSNPQEGVKIKGDILKDNNTLPEDYKDGINNPEYMNHVRFKLTELGLEGIYNQAPVLNVPTENLIVYKELDPKTYNLIKGITFSDDHTEFKESDIKVNYTDISTLGIHEITYELIDDWGRSSGVKKRNLEVKNALVRNQIEFERMYNSEYYTRETAFKLNFVIDEENNGGTLMVSDANNSNFSWHTGELSHYTLTIKGVNGERKYNESFYARDRGNGYKVRKLDGIPFEYGDTIEVYQTAHKGFKIKGPVPNGIEDYSDGADLGEELKDTVFTIQQEGLVADYTPSYKDSAPITNSIQWNLGINGNFGFRLSFDMENRKIIAVDKDVQDEYIDTLGNERDKIFRIELRNRNGVFLEGYDVKARQRPSEVLAAFNNKTIEYGGYISITSYKKPRNLRITGTLVTNKIQRFEDFEDGIDDVERFNNMRFYFTPDGLYAYENEAPRIIGATDLNIIKGEDFTVRDGVTVEDDLDDPEQVALRIDDSTFDKNKIGAHQVTYVATDTWGRSSTYDRFIFVTAKPQITLNDENSIYIEKGSMTSADVGDYLKKIVTVTDEEDDDAELTEELQIKGTFNPEVEKTYPIKYSVTDSDNHTTELDIEIHVVKTINVSVPISVPFQVVTNLKTPEIMEEQGYPQNVVTNQKNPNHSASDFISAQLKILNNHTSDVKVSVKSFNKTEGDLEIVEPNSVSDWDNLSAEESMRKMALGIYNNTGLIGANSNSNNPVWLTENIKKTELGTLNRRERITSNPTEVKLGLTAKYGKKFKGGKTKGKFNIVFEFE